MVFSKELLTTTALGTAQHDVEVIPSLNEVLDKVDPANREKRLLTTAAALMLAEKAGWTPPRDHRPLSEPSVADDMPICSMKAIYYLTLICEGHYRDTLPEWLTEVAKAGKRAPEEALPLLLDLGHKEIELRDLILPVIGERGRWLAEQIRDRQWRWFSTDNDEKIWQNGAFEPRLMLLEALRKTNPARARELLMSTWESESPKNLVEFIKSFAINLSMEDEPFLESLLDTNSPDLRKNAIDLLALLPESRFCQRMIERAVPLLDFIQRFQLKVIRDTPNVTPDMARDGISPEQGGVLQQILSYISPDFWVNHWEVTPDNLLRAAFNSVVSQIFLAAWSWNVYHCRNAKFGAMLLAKIAPENYANFQRLLVPTLPSTQTENLILTQIRIISDVNYDTKTIHNTEYNTTDSTDFVFMALLRLKQPWNHDLASSFLTILNDYQKNMPQTPPSTRITRQGSQIALTRPIYSLLSQFALYVPPDMSAQILGIFQHKSDGDKTWEQLVDEVRLTLDFRRDMLAAIHSNE